MSIDGTYECVTKSPMGEQKSNFTITTNGDGTFTGKNEGSLGSMDIEDGKVDGNRITWVMNMTVPMPMKLEGDATITDGDLTGAVKAGAFGEMAMSGTKV